MASKISQSRRPPPAGPESTMTKVHLAAAWFLTALFAAGLALAAENSIRRAVPLSPPAPTATPDGPLGEAIRYGQLLVTDTVAAAPAYVGNALKCTNCHLDGGRTAYAAPLAGLIGLFPEYHPRRGGVES